MLLDCAIVGGGPAGLNAALVLGRARRHVILFDSNQPRNAVTRHSHGFITRDGVKPGEFRSYAQQDIRRYPSVQIHNDTEVVSVERMGHTFRLATRTGERFDARTILLAAGLREVLPEVRGIHDYYGKSLFSCPYCDGWELRDKPLVVIAEGPNLFLSARIIWNWSRDLILCSNGNRVLNPQQLHLLNSKGIGVMEQRIARLEGNNGLMERVVFEGGSSIARSGGFVSPQWYQAAPFGAQLGCLTNSLNGFVTDSFGRTNVRGVYAAGDTSVVAPSQLIIAAAEGSRAAIGINTDLSEEAFL
ncbi:NAD(P)/FAD-dependent oxidoreductase [Paenibacillus sp. H1-7]|uniref:NAD(P)/FAD-dependent oxidoreductase n=1 Tax=Paenibacillus sp. H1-7 TaxID=2282849 RepID=UPI001EF7C273|nr:NAD(P)/FAD-dependent oxidoreductase [Paenibacillus sp. H1-7]ULL15009.1 NAD(P)/FAD-dependent oxidoreductase [Paenibacillus sp. H1-7]